MQPLDINLASRPFRNNTLIWTALVVLTTGLIGLTYWNYHQWSSNSSEYERIAGTVRGFDEQMRELETRLTRARNLKRQVDDKALWREAIKANEVIEWKAFSWTKLFNRLEAVHPWNVHVTEIRPIFRGEGRQSANLLAEQNKSIPILIEGMSKDLDALFKFERNLFSDPYFFQVEPERHANSVTGEVVFTLRVTFYPDGKPVTEPAPNAAAADDAAAGRGLS